MTEAKHVKRLSNIEIAMLFDYITNNLGNSEIENIITDIFEDFDIDLKILNDWLLSSYDMSILKYAYPRDYIEKITKIENDNNKITVVSETIVNDGIKYTFQATITFIDGNVNIQLFKEDLVEYLDYTTHVTIDLYEGNQPKHTIFDGNLGEYLDTKFSKDKFGKEALDSLYNKFVNEVYYLIIPRTQNFKNAVYEFENLARDYNLIYSNLLDEDSSYFVNWFKNKYSSNVVTFDDNGFVIDYDS